MKILALNSSPKAEKGNTQVMVNAFLEGTISANAETETIFLAKKRIQPCSGCLNCWLKTPGECIFDDDMKTILNKMSTADLLIFATPLYSGNVSGIMKNFMDRTIAKAHPKIKINKNQTGYMEFDNNKPTKIVVISSAGFPEKNQFQIMQLISKKLADSMNAELAAEIYMDEGPLLNSTTEKTKTFVNSYKTLLKTAGQEIVEKNKLSLKLVKKLQQPMVAHSDYVRMVKNHFLKIKTEDL